MYYCYIVIFRRERYWWKEGRRLSCAQIYANSALLWSCIPAWSKKYSACANFNELRTKLFLHSKNKKLTELPCCSDEIRENVKRADLQTQTWLDSPFVDKAALTDPTDYGYTQENGSGLLIPTFGNLSKLPENVPRPCSGCKTCARITCPCRQAGAGCSDFCSCSEGVGCKNPHDWMVWRYNTAVLWLQQTYRIYYLAWAETISIMIFVH